jgi:hypothetical protein
MLKIGYESITKSSKRQDGTQGSQKAQNPTPEARSSRPPLQEKESEHAGILLADGLLKK